MLVSNQLVACPHCGGLTMASIPTRPKEDELFLGFHVKNSNPAACRCCGKQFSVSVDWQGRIALSRHP